MSFIKSWLLVECFGVSLYLCCQVCCKNYRETKFDTRIYSWWWVFVYILVASWFPIAKEKKKSPSVFLSSQLPSPPQDKWIVRSLVSHIKWSQYIIYIKVSKTFQQLCFLQSRLFNFCILLPKQLYQYWVKIFFFLFASSGARRGKEKQKNREEGLKKKKQKCKKRNKA